MNWRKGIKDGDDVLKCPECLCRHYLVSAKVRTDVRRKGRHLTFETGNVCQCLNPKCRTMFATTDDGVIRLGAPTPSQPVYQNNTEPPNFPTLKTKAGEWTPRMPKAGV